MTRGKLEVVYRIVNRTGQDDCDLTRAEAVRLHRALQVALRQPVKARKERR